jgi:hypothetical protein
MYKNLLLTSFCLFYIFCSAQKTGNNSVPGRTHFIAELGGPGILFSANIDTRFTKSTLGWGGRIGLGFVTADEYDSNFGYELRSVVTIPAQVNYVFGKTDSPNTLEVGAGVTYVGRKLEIFNFYDDKTTNLFGTVSFMYRRQPLKGGFTWRAGFTPLIAKGYIQPSGALSVGFCF